MSLSAEIAVAHAEENDAQESAVESSELRQLRLAEESMFQRASASTDSTSPLSERFSTGDVGPAPPAVGIVPRWLANADLPEFGAEWSVATVRFLEYFRGDTRGRDLIRAWYSRQRVFGSMIRTKIRERNLPPDLLYVAMVESGFDARARSNREAAGLWQFVPATGAEFGLTRNHWTDLRLDPERSTDAALTYLAHLHERFANWELALAAYNMGYGALLRAMRAYGTNDYHRLIELEGALPFETTLYVAKITACAIVARNPLLFGLPAPEPTASNTWTAVDVRGGISFGMIARAANSTDVEIRDLNPEYLRARTPPTSSSFRIRVPSNAATQLEARLARLMPRTPPHRNYAVRFGDTLASIARRFRCETRVLRELNQFAADEVYPEGFPILVPNVEPLSDVVGEAPTAVVPNEERNIPAARNRFFYPIRRGDTMAAVAEFFHVSLRDLVSWNVQSARATIPEGTLLQVFLPSDFSIERAVLLSEAQVRALRIDTPEYYQTQATRQGLVRVLVRVRDGDTLGGIAQRFGLRVGSLVRANGLPESTVLQLGQNIVVYAEARRVPSEYREQLAQQNVAIAVEETATAPAEPQADTTPAPTEDTATPSEST